MEQSAEWKKEAMKNYKGDIQDNMAHGKGKFKYEDGYYAG